MKPIIRTSLYFIFLLNFISAKAICSVVPIPFQWDAFVNIFKDIAQRMGTESFTQSEWIAEMSQKSAELSESQVLSELAHLAQTVQEIAMRKSDLEKKIKKIKNRHFYRNVVLSLGLLSGATAALYSWFGVSALTGLAFFAVDALGTTMILKICFKIWMGYSEGKMQKVLSEEKKKLVEGFGKALRMAPAIAVRFVQGVASEFRKSPQMVRDAAIEALAAVNLPETTAALKFVAASAFKAGHEDDAEEILKIVLRQNRERERQKSCAVAVSQ
jgi:hypothetical protein